MARKFTYASALPQSYYVSSSAASRQERTPKVEPVRSPEEQAAYDEMAVWLAARKASRKARGLRY